jgi:hypothetical protein
MRVKPAAQERQTQTAARDRVACFTTRPRDLRATEHQVEGGGVNDSCCSYAAHRVFASDETRGRTPIPPESARAVCGHARRHLSGWRDNGQKHQGAGPVARIGSVLVNHGLGNRAAAHAAWVSAWATAASARSPANVHLPTHRQAERKTHPVLDSAGIAPSNGLQRSRSAGLAGAPGGRRGRSPAPRGSRVKGRRRRSRRDAQRP